MVSDIAPSCPHCGRPFYENVKNPAAKPPSQDGFKDSATEAYFKEERELKIRQQKILKFCLFLPFGMMMGYVTFLFTGPYLSMYFPGKTSGGWLIAYCAIIGAPLTAWFVLKEPKQ